MAAKWRQHVNKEGSVNRHAWMGAVPVMSMVSQVSDIPENRV